MRKMTNLTEKMQDFAKKFRKKLTKFCQIFEFGAVRRRVESFGFDFFGCVEPEIDSKTPNRRNPNKETHISQS